MQRQLQRQLQREPSDAMELPQRGLYEQAQSKTLLFSAMTSNKLKRTDGSTATFEGLYRCTLGSPPEEDLFDDNTHYGEDEEICNEATLVGVGRNFVGDPHPGMRLRNLQFDLASLRQPPTDDNAGETIAGDDDSFLYANYVEKNEDSKKQAWEIVRAKLPDAESDDDNGAVGHDGSLTFQSVFKTRYVSDWNECDFDCCTKADYEAAGMLEYAKNFDDNYEFRHSYVRGVPRSFVVDQHTGDIFVSWEGFYKDCEDVHSARNGLQWTIGISRLKTEDPSCMALDLNRAKEQYSDFGTFARCTVPVSIVYQSTRARESVLPYGGLAVVPASMTGTGHRTFLMTVLYNPGNELGGMTARVWAFPEGASSTRDGLKRQDLVSEGTRVDGVFYDAGIYDAGSLRLNYNPEKGRPDWLCRTVFDAGIDCFPIDFSVDENNGFPIVSSTTSETEVFLTGEQTASFCHLDIADRVRSDPYFKRDSLLATGLDVQWDPVATRPHRIFFGCASRVGGNGHFGSVQSGGSNLKTVLEYGYATAVLFLPSELEGSLEARATASSYYGADGGDASTGLLPWWCFAGGVLLLFLAVAYKPRNRKQRFSSPGALRKETGFLTPYVELHTMNKDHCNNDGSNIIGPLTEATTTMNNDDNYKEEEIAII